jgi:hypothetical protein
MGAGLFLLIGLLTPSERVVQVNSEEISGCCKLS